MQDLKGFGGVLRNGLFQNGPFGAFGNMCSWQNCMRSWNGFLGSVM